MVRLLHELEMDYHDNRKDQGIQDGYLHQEGPEGKDDIEDNVDDDDNVRDNADDDAKNDVLG